MDKKSFASTERTRKPTNQSLHKHQQNKQKDVSHEIFKVDHNDFPSLQDISTTTNNQNKTSLECKKTFFSYSDKLKAPPQESSSNIFKFGKDFNDVNKNEQSTNQTHSKNKSSPSKDATKNKFQSNSETAKTKKVQESTEQKHPASRITQLSNRHNQQGKGDSSSSVHIPEEEMPSAEGWTLYQKHSSTKHKSKTTEQSSDSTYKTDKFHNSDGKQPLAFNKIKGQTASRVYRTNDSKNVFKSDFEIQRMDARREVPSNYQFNKPKHANSNPEAGHTTSSTFHQSMGAKALHSVAQPYARNVTYNRSISSIDSKDNFPINKPRFPKVSATEVRSASSSNTPNHKFKPNDQQEHNRNRTQDKNINRNNCPSTSMSQSHSRIHDTQAQQPESAVTKTKKKRKSKVKRQAALQTGKIFILTPEAHSKILNQASNAGAKSQTNVTNINDDEEYPELGLGAATNNQKKIPQKIGGVDLKAELPVSSHESGLEVEKCDATTTQNSIANDIRDSDIKVEDVISTEAVLPNVSVHSSNQITVSLFDMLLTKKSKKKEVDDKVAEEELCVEYSPVKVRTKKVLSQPVNPLASSKPTVKRGKEREQPKLKKPSKMRKLILMGRQMKKENMALKNSETRVIDPSDTDTDTLSDGSSLSPTKSPNNENRLPKTNSHSVNLISQDQISMSNCKQALFTKDEQQENCSVQKNMTSFSSLNNAIEGNFTVTPSLINSSTKYENTTLDYSKLANISIDPNVTYLLDDVIESDLNCEAGLVENQYFRQDLECVNKLEDNYLLLDNIKHKTLLQQELNPKDLSTDVCSSTLVDTTLDNTFSSHSKTTIEPKILKKVCKNNMSENNINQSENEIPYSKSIEDFSTKLVCSILEGSFSEISKLRNNNLDKGTSELLPESTLQDSDSDSSFPNVPDNTNRNKDIDTNEALFSLDNQDCHSVTSIEYKEKIDSNVVLNTICKNLENSPTQIETKLSHRKFSEEEKLEAAKILIHTRRFRDYCTHFVTKDLDEAVFSLIDDLARFQDRMHQKDPVKARIKRRLLYGIKEIKKHLALKKLKCIIMATDIEDNKTQGGLNDLLREVLSLSEAYHIPYVFSHKRFNLGKVCRKPAPVSCVGVLNYEGSEKNFKRMLELKEENQLDYTMITKELVQYLTDDHILSLLENLQKYEISKLVMKEIFSNDLIGAERNETYSVNLEPKVLSMGTLNVSVTNINHTLIEKLKNSKVPEKLVNNVCIDPESADVHKDFGVLDIEKAKMYTILKKYNVIKT